MKVCLLSLLLVLTLADCEQLKKETKEKKVHDYEYTSNYPEEIKLMLEEALANRPKAARQIFQTGTFIGEAEVENTTESSAETRHSKTPGGEKKAAVAMKRRGWQPVSGALGTPLTPARVRPITLNDVTATALNLTTAGSRADNDTEDEDRDAQNSYISPSYVQPPTHGYGYGGAYGGYAGYGGYQPYIYVLPIVLPPAPYHYGGYHGGYHGGYRGGYKPGGHVVTTSDDYHEIHHRRSLPPAAPPTPMYPGYHAGRQDVASPPYYAVPGYVPTDSRDDTVQGGTSSVRDIDPPHFTT